MHTEYNIVPIITPCFDTISVSEWTDLYVIHTPQVVLQSKTLTAVDEKCWVNWRVEEKDGRLTKVPYRPDGRKASTTNPDDWSTYAEVDTARGVFSGIGIVFTGSLLGVDIDHCIQDGEVSSEVATFVEEASSYTEVSPSGTGLHVYLKLTEPMMLERNRSGGYECYTSERFFTVTEQAWKNTYPLRTTTPTEASNLLKMLGYPWKKVEQTSIGTTNNSVVPVSLTDEELLKRMFSAKNGAKIKALYNGDTSEYGNHDDSVADAALCTHLAFWTGKDATRIESLWLSSPLGSREKTQKRKGYRNDTIAFAIAGCRDTYKGGSEKRVEQGGSSVTRGSSRAVLTRFSDIPPESIQWLWEGRIARGKLTLIAGDPGFGKSLLTIDLAARISKGADWPDFPIPAPLGDTVLLSVEDGRGDTVRPRLDAAGADCTRVYHLEGAMTGEDGKSRPRTLSFKRDMDTLEDALKTLPECRLVVVDPVSAYLDDTDSHKNADVRGLLAPLAELAERLKIAVILIQHLNKGSTGGNALYRPMGSLAFVAAARAAYIVTKDKDNKDRRLMLPAKNNLAKDTTGLAYVITKTDNGMPRLVWESTPISISADDALAETGSPEKRSDTDWAVEVVRDALIKGPLPSEQLYTVVHKLGVSPKQAHRAAGKLDIKPKKSGFDGPWTWALPGHEDAQGTQDATNTEEVTLGDDGHLGHAVEDSQGSQDAAPIAEVTTEPVPDEIATAYRFITTADELKEILPSLISSQKVTLDTETTGLDPYTCKIRLVQLATDAEVVIVDTDHVAIKELQPLFDSSATIIGHNLKFDLQFLMSAGISIGDKITFFDTLLMDQVVLGSRIPRSLKVVAEEYLGTVLDKTHQTAEWGGTLTPEMLQYAARDVAILLPLHSCISTILLATSLLEVAALENEALPFIVQLELAGVPIDSDKWRALTEGASNECTRLEAELNQIAGKSINWNSPKQVTGILKEHGVVVESTSESALSLYGNHPVISTLLKYREQRKYLTTYGEKFLQFVQVETGRIHPNFRQIGADSGRMACSTPNMQNVPRNQKYRACIAPKDGRVLVKADYSQIELRIAAQISGDKRLIEAYKGGSDIHTLTAQLILGKETPTKEDRQAAKAINFGLLYGMGAPRLKEYAKNTYGVELTEGDAVRFRNKFFATYSGLRAWHQSQPEGFRTLKTLSGRKRFNVERFTEKLNTPVQGTGADGLKATLGILWKERAKFPTAQPVLVVHDEIVMECDVADAPLIAEWLKDCMKRGMELFVKLLPVEVEVTVAETWAK